MTIAKGTIHVLTEKGSGNTPNKYSNLYPKTSADQVADLDTAIEEKVTSMISYNATKTSGDIIGTLNINGTDHVLYSTPDTTYSVATTSTNGLMSATDKTKLDDLTGYILPTASDTLKGGVKIGTGLSMNGDTLNVTIQSSSLGGGAEFWIPHRRQWTVVYGLIQLTMCLYFGYAKANMNIGLITAACVTLVPTNI